MTHGTKELGMRRNISALKPRRPHGQHPGLILQRYLASAAAGEGHDAPQERRELFAAAISAAKSDSLQAVYRDAFNRWNASFANDGLHPAVELVTEGRVIIGLGSENVLETGIRLHHTYGVPIIPGSALKGLAAHYCQEVWGCRRLNDAADESSRHFRRPSPADDEQYRKLLRGDRDAKPTTNYFRLLFGSTDDGGLITFHDAWITPASLGDGALRLDVMTPHHSNFQLGPDNPKFKPPTDFDSPVPVSFLSVAGAFQMRLSWNGPVEMAANDAKCWTQLASGLLQEALAEWGVGGKTSSGYGRLVAPSATRPTTSQPLHYATTSTRAAAQPAAPNPGNDKVTVRILERREIGGKTQFFVQEEGKPRGVLAYGTPPPPEKLPQVGESIEVYRNNRDVRNPQYRWDDPTRQQASPSRKPSKGGGRGRR